VFFSEEKNQETLVSAPADRYGTWPDGLKLRRNKSLLLLFFRKEVLTSVTILARVNPVCGSDTFMKGLE
jgi:hypothetical protein